MTESATITNRAQMQCYDDLGVEEYEIVATLDGLTCSHCGDKDGLHYPMDMAKIGSTAPPFHARCRCCTAPYIEGDEAAERMMRDPETGKTEYIPNMSYNEWKEKYLRPTQDYKTLEKGDAQTITTGNTEISYSKLKNFGGDFNISDKLDIKPKRMHEIVTQIREAQKKAGIKGTPKFIIADSTELPDATLGRYSAAENAIIYKFKETGKLDPHMLVHEMLHWNDAQAYIKEHGKIENEAAYIAEMSRKCKKKLDRAGVDTYNISEVSKYTKLQYMVGRFGEAYTEYRTKLLLGD